MLRPDFLAARLRDVRFDRLAAEGVRGIMVDLDNTLVAYGGATPHDDDVAWIAEALARDFRVVLISNNFTGRVGAVARGLGVGAVPSALKPAPFAFLRALRLLGTPRAATVIVGDQLFTDVLGARLVGVRSILVEPLVARDWHGTRVLRTLERLLVGRDRARLGARARVDLP